MLAKTLTTTEIMVLNFNQQGHLSQRMGQALINTARHPEFRVEDLQSATIVKLLRKLERPFRECVMVELTLVQFIDAWRWKPEPDFGGS